MVTHAAGTLRAVFYNFRAELAAQNSQHWLEVEYKTITI